MITDNPDTNRRQAESSSSRPMTLRQQLYLIIDTLTEDVKTRILFRQKLDALYQEIAREAVQQAFETHHKQYPDCPPKLLTQKPAETCPDGHPAVDRLTDGMPVPCNNPKCTYYRRPPTPTNDKEK